MGRGDPGYIADRALWLRDSGQGMAMRSYLAQPRQLSSFPGDVEKWYEVLLTAARGAAADGQNSLAYQIASQVDDAYPAGTDISDRPYGERDDYTSLTWLAGTTALEQAGRPRDAIGMFERYSHGSKTPQTQSKGLYWAGRAAEAAGEQASARGYFQRAAGFPDLY
jgi:soluble lytic murein transglycosylase